MTVPSSGRVEPPAARTEVALLIVALLVAVASGLSVTGNRVPGWERGLFRTVNDLPGALYGPVWMVMQLGNAVAIPVSAALALAVRRFRLAIGLGVAGLAVYLLATVMKTIVDRGRPAVLLAHVHVRGTAATGKGYPSGHAAVAFSLAVIAWLWFGPRLRWTLVAAAVVVCFGRVYVGAHFPLDVLGGAALGVASGALVGLLLRVRHHGRRHRLRHRSTTG